MSHATPLSGHRDRRYEILDAVRSLSTQAYDWDGDGALPIRREIIRFLLDIFPTGKSGLDLTGTPEPKVSLQPNGSIVILFEHTSGRSLELTIPCDGVIAYIRDFGDFETVVYGEVREYRDSITTLYREVGAALAWLREGQS